MGKLLKSLILAITAAAVFAFSAYAVTYPMESAATNNGRFIYVPDQTNLRIRVIDADQQFGAVNAHSTETRPKQGFNCRAGATAQIQDERVNG